MMTRGGEGVSIPPKNDDVIYEQPLINVYDARSIRPMLVVLGTFYLESDDISNSTDYHQLVLDLGLA